MTVTHTHLISIMTRLPGDYSDYGGEVVRWENPNLTYPDCSGGCKWAVPLSDGFGLDWVVCTNVASHRVGLLTFEHQGCLQFEAEDDDE